MYLKRHFHSLAIERNSRHDLKITAGLPLIVYANHPSWWDPLVAHYLNLRLFSERQFYAPIDADALAQYQVFAKLGFYGVNMNCVSGAAAFLKQSLGIARARGTAIWITPEGRFADVRDHQAELMPGLAHLCTRLDDGWVLPLALEYVFWEERLPHCLTKLGEPFRIGDHQDRRKSQWQQLLTERLRNTQIALAELTQARSSEPFDPLLRGKRGAGTLYDTSRRLRAWMTGREFRAAHGEHFE